MKEYIQAARFYNSLNSQEQRDLEESIAASIYFLDAELQENIILMMRRVDIRLSEKIAEINNFTIC